MLANEPNRAHTFVSYRVARLSKTHKVGFARRDLLRELNSIGFSNVRVLRPRVDNWVSYFWIVASKPASTPVGARGGN